MDRLNVGCGSYPDPAATNLDRVALTGVDVVHDLDVHPWPFPDGSFDELVGIQVFEHVADPIGFMVEAHRVLRQGGRLLLTTPHYQSSNAFTDPTHVRFCTERTWDYWIDGSALHRQFNPAYGAVTFQRVKVERRGDDLWCELLRP